MTPTSNRELADVANRQADLPDFRDHLATADKQGNRKWIYPKKPRGRWYQYRSWVSYVLLIILFTGPFIRINGNPLLLFNIPEGRFSILGQMFWPGDMIIFAVAMLLFLTGIIVFTSAFGRLWCGWTCPQTLLMEMVFRKLEYWLEGNAGAQKALDASPWTPRKTFIKTVKHTIFLLLSFFIGNTLLSYIIGTEQLFQIITDPPSKHLTGLGFMVGFTIIFYLIFARFREQACTFICPYGRFQSAMLDENSMVVAYDYRRGEVRGPLSRRESVEERRDKGLGDCVNCRQCVAVCPTGIDIRNGTQMECVNCTACIDACDAVMQKVGRPKGLIRYASLNSIEHGGKFKFTPRMALYSALLAVLGIVLAALVFTRSEIQAMILRAPGALYQQTSSGQIENLYTLKVVNKTNRDLPVTLKLEGPGNLRIMGKGQWVVPRQNMAQTSVLIELATSELKSANTKVRIGVYANGRRFKTVNTVFLSPRS